VKLGYATNANIRSGNEILTTVKADAFTHAQRLQKVVIHINATNEQKRKAGGAGK
jgi:hypothetical protein